LNGFYAPEKPLKKKYISLTKIYTHKQENQTNKQQWMKEKKTGRKCDNPPLLVASSKSAVSTAAAGKWTYRTTLPRINTFFTEDFQVFS
jgi:hypothetical protein